MRTPKKKRVAQSDYDDDSTDTEVDSDEGNCVPQKPRKKTPPRPRMLKTTGLDLESVDDDDETSDPCARAAEKAHDAALDKAHKLSADGVAQQKKKEAELEDAATNKKAAEEAAKTKAAEDKKAAEEAAKTKAAEEAAKKKAAAEEEAAKKKEAEEGKFLCVAITHYYLMPLTDSFHRLLFL